MQMTHQDVLKKIDDINNRLECIKYDKERMIASNTKLAGVDIHYFEDYERWLLDYKETLEYLLLPNYETTIIKGKYTVSNGGKDNV